MPIRQMAEVKPSLRRRRWVSIQLHRGELLYGFVPQFPQTSAGCLEDSGIQPVLYTMSVVC